MSDKHDHKHDHDHGHDHDHDHGHSHGEIKLKEPSAPAPAPEPTPERAQDDAGSTALSEALRSSFTIVKFVMIGLVVLFFASGVFEVGSQQKAIILRFGKPVGAGPDQLLGPGLHWSFPSPIDEVVKVSIGELNEVRSTTGWYATTPEAEAAGQEGDANPTLNPANDGYAITSDGNIIHARATVRYRVADPIKYTMSFVQATNVVQNIVNEAIFFAASQFTVDQALTADRLGFQEKVLARVRQVVADRDLGITVENGEVRVIPPRFTKTAFDAALSAEIERRKAREDANAYAGRILSTAEGEANSIINAGQSDRTRMTQAVAAEAQNYKNQLPHYQANPNLFMARVQTETLARVMTNVENKFFLPGPADGKPRELRLLLSQEPKKPVAPDEQSKQPQQNR
ncbi:MAG TPA: protease modulator HflK [Verrucomicrobiae bacterium]